MTSKEFKTIGRLLIQVYEELEADALKSGISPLSKEFLEIKDKARLAVLEKAGFTLEQYRLAKAEVSGFSQADMLGVAEEFKEIKKQVESIKIPTQEEIKEIAYEIAQQFIVPPKVTNEIVKETTTIVEKPITVEKTIIEKEEYEDGPIYAELGELRDRVEKIKIADPVDIPKLKEEIRNDFAVFFEKNIDILNMPDFRKLAMGLQGQIDELKADDSSDASTYAKLDGTNQPFTGSLKIGDNLKHYFGTGDDASFYFDGTAMTLEANANPLSFRSSSSIYFGSDGKMVYDVANKRLGIGNTTISNFFSPLHTFVDSVDGTDNNNGLTTGLNIQQNGTGDAQITYYFPGVRSWSMGIDNSDDDKFKISPTYKLGDGVLSIATNGETIISGDIVISNTTPSLQFNDTVNASIPTVSNLVGDIRQWAYTGNSFSVAGEEGGPTGIVVKPDGTKFYISGSSGDNVTQYIMNTPYTIVGAAWEKDSGSVGDSSPQGLFISPDGANLYLCAASGVTIRQFTLTTPWDVGALVFVAALDVSAQDTALTGVTFKSDGTKMYVTGTSNDSIHEYNLGTPWAVSTASFVQTFADTTNISAPRSLYINSDGTIMYIGDTTEDAIVEYRLGTPYDISTAVYYNRVIVGTEETVVNFTLAPSANKMFVVGSTSDTVYEYTTSNSGLCIDSTKTDFSGDLVTKGSLYTNKKLFVRDTSLFKSTMTAEGSFTCASTFSLTTSSNTISLGTSQTSGIITMGGTGGTGTITLGRSTDTQQLDIGVGASATGKTKTINIGTAGLSGSTTAINIGSAVTGGTSTILLNKIVGIGTTLPQSTLDLGNATGGNSIVWGGATGTGHIGTIGSAYSTGDLIFATRLKLNTADDQLLYSRTVTAGACAMRFDTSVGDILFYNEASKSQTAGEVFDETANLKMILKSSGRLGLGIQAPNYKLDVADTTANTATLATALNLLETSTGDMADGFGNTIRFQFADTGVGAVSIAQIGAVRDGGDTIASLVFYTRDTSEAAGGVEKMRILPYGNIGIGTTNPLLMGSTFYGGATNAKVVAVAATNTNRPAVLELRGKSTSVTGGVSNPTGIVSFTSDEATDIQLAEIRAFGDTANTDGALTFRTLTSGTAATEKMRITSTGLVGIGTTTPGAQLDVSSGGLSLIIGADLNASTRTNSTAKYSSISGAHYTNSEAPLGMLRAISQSDNNFLYLGGGSATQNAATEIGFYTAANTITTTGTRRMTIDSTGNVGINTTAPDKQLEINSATGACLRLTYNDANGSATYYTDLATSSAGVASIAPSGAILNVTGDVRPTTDDTYYLGKNDDDTPQAWKGVILKDTTNGKYYRIEVVSGVITATDLTD